MTNKTVHPCIKFSLFLLAILVLLFLTTPAAAINLLAKSPAAKKALSLEWVEDMPHFVQFLFKGLTPAILVVIVNIILLMILKKTVELEHLHRFSHFQKTLMSRVFVYFLFNMVIVPGFASSALSNLFEVIEIGVNDYTSLFKTLFNLRSGDFFMIFLLNAGGSAFLGDLNLFGVLFGNYLSPRIAIQSKLTNDQCGQMVKNHNSVFPYGINYSYTLVQLAIGLVFASMVPYLSLPVIFVLLTNHIVDAHHLLIWHRMEIESCGILFDAVQNRLFFILLLGQFSVFFKSLFSGMLWVKIVLGIIFFGTLAYAIFFSRSKTIKEKRINLPERKPATSKELVEWWNLYNHPLVVDTGEFPFNKKTKSFLDIRNPNLFEDPTLDQSVPAAISHIHQNDALAPKALPSGQVFFQPAQEGPQHHHKGKVDPAQQFVSKKTDEHLGLQEIDTTQGKYKMYRLSNKCFRLEDQPKYLRALSQTFDEEEEEEMQELQSGFGQPNYNQTNLNQPLIQSQSGFIQAQQGTNPFANRNYAQKYGYASQTSPAPAPTNWQLSSQPNQTNPFYSSNQYTPQRQAGPFQ